MRVFYLRDEKGFPVACVASDATTEGTGAKMLRYAVSTWNPKDKFDKAMARKVAEGRLKKGHWHGAFSIPTGVMSVKVRFLREVAFHNDLPQRARDAAKYQLTKLT